MMKENGKILIIADDTIFSRALVRIIDKSFTAAHTVESCAFEQGTAVLKRFRPDVIIIDADRWEKEKVADYIRTLMPKYYKPLIACTNQHGSNYGFMNAGAMDVITKIEHDPALFSARLCKSIGRLMKKSTDDMKVRLAIQRRKQGNIIAIGGSTGSTQALPVILQELKGKGTMPPIVAVLHMPETYTQIYAQQIRKETQFEAYEAKSGMYLKNDTVVIAKGGEHLRVFHDKEGYFVTSEAGVKVSGHCPSVDVLFDSVAYCAKGKAIGVILTGMGADGAGGLLNMKKMGNLTIGQDEASSVVYGMPRAAFENGSVLCQKSLDDIADEIVLELKQLNKEDSQHDGR